MKPDRIYHWHAVSFMIVNPCGTVTHAEEIIINLKTNIVRKADLDRIRPENGIIAGHMYLGSMTEQQFHQVEHSESECQS